MGVDGGADVKEPKCQNTASKAKPFYRTLRKEMEKVYSKEEMTNFWNPYFDTVKLWVTEHSCNGDPAYETGKGGSVLSREQCRRITGQSCAHGQGSVRTMLEMENIERFSWFTLRGDARLDHPNYNSITNGSMTDPQSDK